MNIYQYKPNQFIPFSIIVLVYILLYAAFLLSTNLLPYAMDNNETWSNLGHAKNAYDYGFTKSKGLADEAHDYTGNHPEMHPLVHTHQGNFPRLLPTFLYYCGLHSPESHILILTFTVGLAGVMAAYFLIARMVGPAVAGLFCLFMMTDYLMFAQWQVNTWRVWQCLFVFGTLLVTDRLCRINARWFDCAWLFLLITVISYSELVFASFVFSAVLFYSAFKSWQLHNRRWVVVLVVCLLGMICTAGLFACQLISYYGLSSLIQDARYTISARNMMENPEYLQEAIDFMSRNNVLFLKNFSGLDHYHSFDWFINSLFSGVIGSWTPMLFVLVFLGITGPAIKVILKSTYVSDIFPIISFNKQAPSKLVAYQIGISSVFIGWYFLVTNLLKDYLVLNGCFEMYGKYAFAPGTLLGIIVVILCSFILTLSLIKTSKRITNSQIHPQKLYLAGIFLLFISVLISRYSCKHPFEWLPVWRLVLQPQYVTIIYMGGLLGAAFFGTILLLIEDDNLTNKFKKIFINCLPLIGAGMAGYIVAWLWSPGYLKTGYLDRCCPILTYFMYLFPAFVIYFMYLFGLTILKNAGGKFESENRSLIFPLLVVVIFLASILVLWARIQVVSWALIPPNYAQVIKKLTAPEFRGKKITASNYVVPLAFASEGVGSHSTDNGPTLDGKTAPRPVSLDNGGLWIKEGDKVKQNYIPDIYIYLDQPYSYSYVAKRAKIVLSNEKNEKGYLNSPIMQSVVGYCDSPFRSKAIALDPSKWGAWAVIELDNEKIPYLQDKLQNIKFPISEYKSEDILKEKKAKINYVCEYVPYHEFNEDGIHVLNIKNFNNDDGMNLLSRERSPDEKSTSTHKKIARNSFSSNDGADLRITFSPMLAAGDLYIWANDNLKVIPYDPTVSHKEASISFANRKETSSPTTFVKPSTSSFIKIETSSVDPAHVKIKPLYQFKDDAGKSESGSIWRLWEQSSDGRTKLIAENSDQHPFVVESNARKSYFLSVIPKNSTGRTGFEYFSLPVDFGPSR